MSSTLKNRVEFYTEPIHEPFVIEPEDGAAGGHALLIHGFPGTPAEMRPAASALAAIGVTGTGIQLPGLGRQIYRVGATQHSDWISSAGAEWRLIHQNQVQSGKPAVLVGFSMGGAIALHLAQQVQPRCLILIAPFWRFGIWWQQLLLPLVPYFKPTVSSLEAGTLEDPEFRANLLEMAPDLDLDDPAVIEKLKTQMVMPTRLINGIRTVGKGAFRIAPQIKCPVLVIQGSEDKVVQPRLTERLVGRLERNTDVTYVPLTGGHTLVKHSGPFQEHIQSFVARYL